MEPLKDQTVVSPNPAKFTATLKGGEPRSEVSWFKAGKPISVDGVKFVAAFEGDVASLTIAGCEQADAAEYSFAATNKVGNVSSKAQLTVHGTHTVIIHVITWGQRPLNGRADACVWLLVIGQSVGAGLAYGL